ncbi:MAG: hypothetical protein Q8L86_00325 [Vicinamibacterales bacterium]|nr:hypothetical protein [Vicinamibacterales bacterium]
MAMVLPVIGKFSLGSFGFGAAATAVGAVIARPLLVSTIRMGYEATEVVTDAWAVAKREAESIKSDALSQRDSSTMEAELRQLRDEVTSLRAQLGKKAS